MLLGRTRHCSYLHNCLCSRRTIHPGSCHCRILHSSRAQGLQAGDLAALLLEEDLAAQSLEEDLAAQSLEGDSAAQLLEQRSVVEPVPVASARMTQQP